MVNLVFHLVIILLSSVQLSSGEYDPHYADKLAKGSSPLLTETGSNFYTKRCIYDRQCDETYGYICRDGRCTCKFGRPDHSDGFKCKVQVKLGDFCKELSRSSRSRSGNRYSTVYVRRKCPHNSECAEKTSGICECAPLFLRQGLDCVPKILNAGNKPCRAHMDCMVQRGQQCYNGSCVECGVGRFKIFRPMAKWVVARPECACFDKLSELQENTTFKTASRHQNKHNGHKVGSCNPPVSVGDHCTISQNCVSPWTPQLVCEDGICSCPPGSRTFQSLSHPLSTYCILPINSACTEDKDCHGPTAYCETRLEVPSCKCRDGYGLENTANNKDQFICSSKFHEEVCGKFFPQGDKLKDQLKDQRLSCIQGIYECARPQEMFWDVERGKCVSLVGGRCDLNLFDKSSCAGNSRCWEYKGLGEFRCQCPIAEEREEDENTIFSDIYQNQNQQNQGDISEGVRRSLNKLRSGEVVHYKPARDRRSCVRSDL